MTFDGFLEKLEMKFVQSAYIDQIKNRRGNSFYYDANNDSVFMLNRTNFNYVLTINKICVILNHIVKF